ncbi:uncharacterized protein LOC126377429 [Pectinophora gossypiella]|uniref:Uncharacterized protein n=1 Tax=Pectinophora gossypiella TaxID=13191 RepID=A0A1E1W8T4_PECGO|nr:uncharacterized protein LOC126377429 [Pectinophora gossypiella]
MYKIVAFCAFVFLGCLAAKTQKVQLAPEKAGKIIQDALQCVSETGADPAILIQIKDKKYSDDETVKNFFYCAFKKTGMATKKGVIKVDKLLDIYPDTVDKEAIKKVILECQQENGEANERVYKFFKCYQENTPVRLSLMKN